MKNINKEQVYINLNSKYASPLNTNIYVKDVGEVYCKDKNIQDKVDNIKIYSKKNNEAYDYISGTNIIEKVLSKIPNIDLTILGSSDVLLEIKGREKQSNFLNMLKVIIVCILLLFGSAFALIYFFQDVDMQDVVQNIHYIITGSEETNPKIMTIPFSIGIGIGIFVFFNRIFSFSKRRRQEPGTLELELFLYDKNMEDNIMENIKNNDNS